MNDENKIDIMSYIYKMISGIHKTWVIGLVIMIFFASLNIPNLWKKQVPTYSSKVTFSVIKDYNGTSSFSYNKTATENLALSFLTIINSDLMVNAICQDLNVTSIPATFRVERIESTNLFSVYATSTNPNDAKNTLDSLLKNYTQISKVALNDATLTVIEEPVLATLANSLDIGRRQKAKNILMGVIVYSAFLLIYITIRKTFSKDSDIVIYLHSKCIGKIGTFKEMKKGKPLLISKDLKSSQRLKETFRKIRMSVVNDHQKYNHKIYMLTSTLAHEGKSMIAANLALSLAQKNNKVLLIDFDLRNPTQFNSFKLNQKNYNEIKTINDKKLYYFKQIEYDHLDILCTFESEKNASEILSDKAVETMIKELSNQYDYIFIDTPPIHLMADASIVAKYADSSILVIKEDYATIDEAREAMESLKNANFEVLGCILNQVKNMPFVASKYGYGYYSNYGYRYYGGKKSHEN